MAKLLKLRRGTTSQHGSFTGAEGEVTVDTDKETLVVHDGSTAGGHPVAAEDMANVSSASIAGRLGTDSIATSKIAAGALPTDVTVATANIDNDAVSFAKLENIATNHIVGRISGGTGNPEALSGANVRTIINVENGATADQSNAEIRAAVEAASDSNVFTDADHSKLNGIEASATADQTNAEIRAAVEAATDSNVFTDADHSKLNGIAANATNVTNNNQLTNGAGYVTSSGNTIIGTDSDYAGSNANVIDALNLTDGVITSFGSRNLTLANLGFTGASNANYITNNNQLTNGAGYITSATDSTKMPLAGGEFTGDVIAHNIRPDGSSRDLGTSSYRWQNVYTNDLHLSNKGHTNDVDGSWGDWTIQEGESDLFLKNNRSGKKYKFNLTEVS